jgi:hypothetical protein
MPVVHVAVVHRNACDPGPVLVAWTEQGLVAKLADWCRQNWGDSALLGPPDDDDKLVDLVFWSGSDRWYLDVCVAELDSWPSTEQRAAAA